MIQQETNINLKSIIEQLKQINSLKRQVQKALLEKSIQQVNDDLEVASTIKGNYADEMEEASSILSQNLREDIGKSIESARNFPSALTDAIKAKIALKKLNHDMEKGNLSEVEQDLIDEKNSCHDKILEAMKNNDFKTAHTYVTKAHQLDNHLLAEQMSNGRIGATKKREQASIVDEKLAFVKACKKGMKTDIKEIFAEYEEKRIKAKENKSQSLAKIQHKGIMAKIKNLFSQIRLGAMNKRDEFSNQISSKLETKKNSFRKNIYGILDGMVKSNSEQLDQLLQTITELQPNEEKSTQSEKESSKEFNSER